MNKYIKEQTIKKVKSKFHINPDDLKFETFCAGGKGGQNVNKTSTAVRLTHVPTGTVVICQNERSQKQNKNFAMKIMKARLLDKLIKEEDEKVCNIRREQVGNAERGQKIRTYDYKKQLVIDHRLNNGKVFNLKNVLNGEIDGLIGELIKVRKEERKERIIK